MRINYNVSSIIAMNALNNNDNRLSISTQKLSSGYKINSASDDAAGLAIARKMNAQIKSLQRANRNANDGLSVVNTADGAMSEMHSILQRMNELSIQAANGTNADSDREQIQLEVDQLIKEVDRIADTTQFNAQNLLDGSFAYKGYTNSENVKVMSYSEGVQSGVYAISTLTYNRYQDKTTYVASTGKETTTDERFEAESADSVKNALVTNDTISNYNTIDGIKAFPEGTVVRLEDENIVIKGENDFELKITLNGRDSVDVPGITTTTTTVSENMTTHTYKNILVTTGGSGSAVQYSISNLSVRQEQNGNIVCYTNSEEEKLNGLKEDLADYFDSQHEGYDVDIDGDNYTVDETNGTLTLNVTYTNPQDTSQQISDTITFQLYQDTDSAGNIINQKTMNDYLYSTTETVKTTYTIGKGTAGDCLTLDLTGMGAMIVQVGANEGQYLEIEIPALNAINLGINKLDVTTEDSATASIDIVGKAINQLSAVRAKIGAYANRIEHTITNLDTTEENMTASYSRIMDVDMAEEMTEYSTVQVLVQASTSVLAQANERPQQVLQLLQ